MTDRINSIAKPELLIWARNSAGYSIDVAAKKIQVKSERLTGWERGELTPTLNQLRNMGRIYKRPIAVFFLPEPPYDFQPLHDYRRLSGEPIEEKSPNLIFEIRQAYNRREIALDLSNELGDTPSEINIKADLSDNPDQIAKTIRSYLGITDEKQKAWRTPYDALNAWRSALEKVGVLVFQTSGVELSEMRGFSIAESPFPVIVANNKDAPHGRIFTLLHEFVHVLLRDGGLCDLHENDELPPDDKRVEMFCNRVAGASLVPKEILLSESLLARKEEYSDWSEEELTSLSKHFSVSKAVILRRLLICQRTTKEFYQSKIDENEKPYQENIKFKKGQKKKGGFAPPHIKAISSAGPSFTRIIFNGFYQKKITVSDLSDYLNVKTKHFGKIEQLVFRNTY